MALNTSGRCHAEDHGYYVASAGTDAQDILDYLSADMQGFRIDRPSHIFSDDRIFKVTVTVEEL